MSTRKEVIEERIKAIENECASLRAELAGCEAAPEHGFKVGDMYWHVEMQGEVDWYNWNDDETDNGALAIGNAFHTKEEAEQRLEYLKAEATLRRFMKGKPKGDWALYWEDKHKCFYSTSVVPSSFYCPKFLRSDQHTISKLIEKHERELKIYFEVPHE